MLTLNQYLGYDLNTVEFAIRDGVPMAIDFCNPAPDAERTQRRRRKISNGWWKRFPTWRSAKRRSTLPDRDNLSWGKIHPGRGQTSSLGELRLTKVALSRRVGRPIDGPLPAPDDKLRGAPLFGLVARPMSIEVKIPAVGESITSGVVSVWHKKSGDYVEGG